MSDLHFDKHFNYSSLEKAFERQRDIYHNFEVIVNDAKKDKVDLFLMAGDIFDRILPSNYARVFLTQKVRELHETGIQVVIIGGNHEVPKTPYYTPLSIDILDSAGLATVFSRSDQIQKRVYRLNGKSVCVSGKSYYAQDENQNPLKGSEIPVEGEINIALLHGSLRGLGVMSTIPGIMNSNPISPDDIPSKLDYLALGHFHNHYDRVHNGCQIANPGSIERLDWAELNDDKGYYQAELGGSEPKIEFVKLPLRPMEKGEYTLDRETKLPLSSPIIDFLAEHSTPEKIFKITLKGFVHQQQYATLRLNEIYHATRDTLFHLDVDEDIEVEGLGRLSSARIENPLEAFDARMDKLLGSADDVEKTLLVQVKEIGRKYLEEERN